MFVEITKIEAEALNDDGYPVVTGYIDVRVNGKEGTMFVYECGDSDWEGPELSDEEFDGVCLIIGNSKSVQRAFDPENYQSMPL